MPIKRHAWVASVNAKRIGYIQNTLRKMWVRNKSVVIKMKRVTEKPWLVVDTKILSIRKDIKLYFLDTSKLLECLFKYNSNVKLNWIRDWSWKWSFSLIWNSCIFFCYSNLGSSFIQRFFYSHLPHSYVVHLFAIVEDGKGSEREKEQNRTYQCTVSSGRISLRL